jgi:hypothetical protein
MFKARKTRDRLDRRHRFLLVFSRDGSGKGEPESNSIEEQLACQDLVFTTTTGKQVARAGGWFVESTGAVDCSEFSSTWISSFGKDEG